MLQRSVFPAPASGVDSSRFSRTTVNFSASPGGVRLMERPLKTRVSLTGQAKASAHQLLVL